jgi:cell division protein FtsW
VARKLKSDKVLFAAALLLVCASIVMVFSASAFIARNTYEDEYFFVVRQMLWAVLGVAALAVAMRIDYRAYRNDAFVWGVVVAVGVLLVAVLFSAPLNGARRWFNVGGLGIQPSELAKIACVLFTALILERRMHRIDEFRYALLPIAIVVGVLVALILQQPDLGTAVSLLLIVGTMVFAAGLGYRQVAVVLLVAAPVLTVVALSADYRVDRVVSFLDPWGDRLDGGYQAVQSQIAVGTGGLVGRGLTAGVQKLFFLPYPHTDFIYAVIGEELGLIGATGVLLCFCVIGWRGMRTAARAEDAFGSLVALGITMMICAQAFINISVVLSLLPTKGIPLPLVSSGGSSLLVSLAAVGVLLNISQHETGERVT